MSCWKVDMWGSIAFHFGPSPISAWPVLLHPLLCSFSELVYSTPVESLVAFRELNGQKARENFSVLYLWGLVSWPVSCIRFPRGDERKGDQRAACPCRWLFAISLLSLQRDSTASITLGEHISRQSISQFLLGEWRHLSLLRQGTPNLCERVKRKALSTGTRGRFSFVAAYFGKSGSGLFPGYFWPCRPPHSAVI